eukprot:scaffold90417_cov60-Phaeocystis_antarctica.AAC.3
MNMTVRTPVVEPCHGTTGWWKGRGLGGAFGTKSALVRSLGRVLWQGTSVDVGPTPDPGRAPERRPCAHSRRFSSPRPYRARTSREGWRSCWAPQLRRWCCRLPRS